MGLLAPARQIRITSTTIVHAGDQVKAIIPAAQQHLRGQGARRIPDSTLNLNTCNPI
jgi:hypothetical protein